MENVTYRPIGVIRTPFQCPKGMPKGADASEIEGIVNVSERYAAGLSDLEGFSHILLVWHMHLSEGPMLMVMPWKEKRRRGVFSTRSPRRPNPIGITLVRLERVEGNILHVRGVDMADGTPLLDIKPYLPEADRPAGARTGWWGERQKRGRSTGSGQQATGKGRATGTGQQSSTGPCSPLPDPSLLTVARCLLTRYQIFQGRSQT